MPVETPDFGSIFYPKSVAVAGASGKPESPGRRFIQALLCSGYRGRIYALNSSASEVMGITGYANLKDVPGPVDNVIFSIPASDTPRLMRECVAKGVKAVQVFTAGFSESGTEEGKRLEKEIVNIARRGNIRVIGPNCMGIICPESGLAFFTTQQVQEGTVALLSQSGGIAQQSVDVAAVRGLGFSKIISYGNAADLNEADFLSYLAHDDASKIIAIYIEGVKDGQRFIQVLKEATAIKPVILLKGGKTTAGAKAANSHTSSLAGSSAVWQALCQQTGAMQVQSQDELGDLIVTFAYLSPPKGRRVAVVGIGGGRSVLAADECESAGFTFPDFSPDTLQELCQIMPETGTSVHNPIDGSPFLARSMQNFSHTMELVACSEVIDFVIVYLYTGMGFYTEAPHLIQQNAEAVIRAAQISGKPAAVVLAGSGALQNYGKNFEVQQTFQHARLPVYPSIHRAAQAISRFLDYHERAF